MAFPPPDFGPFLARLTRALAGPGLPFMLIGVQAVLVHGRARLTEDVDVTLGADPRRLPELLQACAALGLEVLPANPERFVAETFVLPARDPVTGIRVDFIFSTTPYEAQAIARAVPILADGVPVPIATAEDLVIHKLFAGRPRDLEDAESVVRRRGATLDWDYLTHWVAEFAALPGRERMTERLEHLRRVS